MVVVLYNIRSLHNVGSIFRTAEGAGLKKIYLTGITPSPLDELGRLRQQLTKVSLGAEKYIEWEKINSAKSLIRKLKKEKYKIWAIEQASQAIPYYKIKSYDVRRRKIALVLGNEIRGLPASILKESDKILEIPLRGKKESLNVAVAFGIVVFYLINLYNKKYG